MCLRSSCFNLLDIEIEVDSIGFMSNSVAKSCHATESRSPLSLHRPSCSDEDLIRSFAVHKRRECVEYSNAL